MLQLVDTDSAPVADLQPLVLDAEDVERLDALRARCPACHGDPDVCQAGTPCSQPEARLCGEDCSGHKRLPGCRAFMADGGVGYLGAPLRARQPWELAA